MAGTRRSTRISSSQDSQKSSPPQSQSSPKNGAGTKRKAEAGDSPSAKRGKKKVEKEQKTLEEVLENDTSGDVEKQNESGEEESQTQNGIDKPATSDGKSKTDEDTNGKDTRGDDEDKPTDKQASDEDTDMKDSKDADVHATATADSEDKEDNDDDNKNKTSEDNKDPQSEQPKKEDAQNKGDTGDAVIPDARDEDVPSSILEKGIIYFFYRGRVGIDEPSEVEDIARSYIVLRPLPHGAKIGDGPIGDENNCRILAVPKKVLPVSGKDKWTAFVEKAKTSFKDLKESFLGSEDYVTKTTGTRHTPAAVPAAEGVYAITTTGRESHLAYIITLPTELGDVQNDLGLRERGSFVTSVKNPKAPGPANADLGKDPGYSQDILNDFRSLRWAPLQPRHLDYEACQFLLIGEGDDIEKATEPQKEDTEKDKLPPKEELEKLEKEDEIRVKHLHNEDAIFADLGTDSKNYPGMQTTW